jgi:hypothetical protein
VLLFLDFFATGFEAAAVQVGATHVTTRRHILKSGITSWPMSCNKHLVRMQVLCFLFRTREGRASIVVNQEVKTEKCQPVMAQTQRTCGGLLLTGSVSFVMGKVTL